MEYTQVLIALPAAFLGWAFGELSKINQRRSDHKQAISMAISDLLEIRFEIYVIREMCQYFKKRFNLDRIQYSQVSFMITSLLPISDDISNRYNHAVDEVSKYDPLLAFQLRSKDQIQNYIVKMQKAIKDEFEGNEDWEEFEDALFDLIIPRYDDIILDVARLKSWNTKNRIKRYFKNDFDKDMKDYLDKYMDMVIDNIKKRKLSINDNTI